jgi:histidinol-phosphate/aromatic aminotransferase/cobyric acid decarboxylase-like protein
MTPTPHSESPAPDAGLLLLQQQQGDKEIAKKQTTADSIARNESGDLSSTSSDEGETTDTNPKVLNKKKAPRKISLPAIYDPSHREQKRKATGAQKWDATNWDLNTQQPHGGQEWSSMGKDFVEDFSVTTNFMGPPWKAVTAASSALQHIEHYPAANMEPALSDLARWVQHDSTDFDDVHSRLMLGNGASELIDLVTRIAAPSGAFVTKSATQYREYERAALADGRKKVKSPIKGEKKAKEEFAILAVINPCNPTGEYMHVNELKEYITTMTDGQNHTKESKPCLVLVDESMQLWHGPGWREDSLVSQSNWIREMRQQKNIAIYIIHSWTKIWSCPGIRLGSVICPTPEDCKALKEHQVPWSLNICALAFLTAAIEDEEYLQQTWDLTVTWRARTVSKLMELHPNWTVYGEPWLSWIWVDTHSSEEALEAVRRAKAVGCPIRNGAMGYEMPTFIRLAVRSPSKQDTLFQALKF